MYGEAIDIPANYAIYDAEDQLALMKRVVENLNLDPKRFARPVLSTVSRAKNDALTPEKFKKRVEEDSSSSYFQEVTIRAYSDYQNALRQVPALDFDDLLVYLVVGIILGGRLGYVIFYNITYYTQNFLEIFNIRHF